MTKKRPGGRRRYAGRDRRQGHGGGLQCRAARRKADQELKAEVVYPADYAEPKLAGKTVAYEVTVKAIKKRIVPELDDDFAKEMGHYENLADLEARVRDHLSNRKRRTWKARPRTGFLPS